LVGSAVLGNVPQLVAVVAAFVLFRTVAGEMSDQITLETAFYIQRKDNASPTLDTSARSTADPDLYAVSPQVTVMSPTVDCLYLGL